MDTLNDTLPTEGAIPPETAARLRQEAEEVHARRKAERQRLGRAKAAWTVADRKKTGAACGVVIPPGYTREYVTGSRKPVVDPATAPLALEAFALAEQGLSLRRIVAVLTPKGLASRNGTPMSASSLRGMLTNPFYCGLIHVDGKLVEGRHEALISREAFERVGRLLTKRRRVSKSSTVTSVTPEAGVA